MAKYQVKAMLLAPSEDGYTQQTDPKAFRDFKILEMAFKNEDFDTMQFVLNDYRYDNGSIEEHKDVENNVLIEGNDDAFYLLEKINTTKDIVKQSIYLGWRYYRDINTEDIIRQLVHISTDYDTMVKTLEKEFSLSNAEFVKLNENAELKSESFGYCGGLFIEEQVVDAFWNGYTPIVKLKEMNGIL